MPTVAEALATLGLTIDDLRTALDAPAPLPQWTEITAGRWYREEQGNRWFKLAGDRLGAEAHLFDDTGAIHLFTPPAVPVTEPRYPLDRWQHARDGAAIDAPELATMSDDAIWERLEQKVQQE